MSQPTPVSPLWSDIVENTPVPPSVSGAGQSDSPSHMDTSPGGSYADRVTLGAVDSCPKVSNVAPRRRSYLSSFEREHFDVLNVMPDRPASAYFTLPDSSVTTKQIFDSLVRDGFPPTSVRCLQRSQNGSVVLTFTKEEIRNKFLQQSSFFVGNQPHAAHLAGRALSYVVVYDAPFELPDSALTFRLSKYGTVYSQRRSSIQGFPQFQNGIRTLRMCIDDPIPSYLRFGKYLLRVQYEGQVKTCRRCNEPGHLAQECRQMLCFNCEVIGHHARDCPAGVRCCICKEPGHMAIDCRHSWYRRPLSHRDAVDAEPPSQPAADPLPVDVPPTLLDAENADSGDVDLDSLPVENAEEDSAGSEDDSLEAEFDQPLASALSSEPAPDLLTSQGLIKDAPDVQVPGVQEFPISSLTDTSVESDESEPESIATSELMDSDAVPDNISPVSERPSRLRKRSRHGSSRRAALGKSFRLSVVSEDAPT